DTRLMRKPRRCCRHGVEPPSLFGFQPMPIADGDSNLLRLYLWRFDRPEQYEKFFAEQPLHRGLVRPPPPGGLAFDLEAAVEFGPRLGRDDVPYVARCFASEYRFRSPLRLAVAWRTAEHLEYLHL